MNNNTIKSTSRISKFRFASFYFAAVLIAISLFGLVKNGLNLGLDFTGGYLTEFSTEQPIYQQTFSYLPQTTAHIGVFDKRKAT